jgi:hypothetical protein
MLYKITVLYHDLSFPLHSIKQGLFEFDGTPYSAAREWAALYGFKARYFTATTPGYIFEIIEDARASVRIEGVFPIRLTKALRDVQVNTYLVEIIQCPFPEISSKIITTAKIAKEALQRIADYYSPIKFWIKNVKPIQAERQLIFTAAIEGHVVKIVVERILTVGEADDLHDSRY